MGIVGLVAVAQLLDLIKFVLNHFGKDQFFPLLDGVLAFVDQMIVLTWSGLRTNTRSLSPCLSLSPLVVVVVVEQTK